MNKVQKLTLLHKSWFTKCTCALKHTATQPVPGVGNPDADIVFIGEAPGRDEDKHGEPFIGRAGKLLSELLESINLSRDDVYITNTVKYRPPNNRDPLPREVDACRDWLSDELTLIEPLVVVLLGRHALARFIPEAKISDVHGTLLIKQIEGIPTDTFFALYHPAAALYNGSLKDVLKRDMKLLHRTVLKLKREK